MNTQYDVGVVGYGACSAVLVNLLAACGLSVVVFDKEADVLSIPRAGHFDDETVRTFQALGAADELAATFSTSASYGIFNALDQRVWGSKEFSHTPTDQGWLSDYFIFQPDVERYLRNKAAANGVVAKLGCQVIDFDDRGDKVLVTFKDLAEAEGAAAGSLSVRYLVGADGASSFVRKKLGIEMEKLADSQRWMVVDVKVREGVNVELSEHCWTKVGQEETITYVPMPKDMKRFEISLRPEQTEEEVSSNKAVKEFLARWFKDGEYDVLRANVYHFHSMVAKSWGQGRIFIAGDAAHLNPPFLGQGVCTAIRDAVNLSWKLARVVQGDASPKLLDTYQSERRPHAYAFVNISGQIGIQIAWMGNASAEQMALMKDVEYASIRPALGPGLHDANSPNAGILSPQPRLADGTRLDDRVGYQFALVGDPEIVHGVSSSTSTMLDKLRIVRVADMGEDLSQALAKLDARVMLIRPDRYLAGVANTSAEVDSLVSQIAAVLGGGEAPLCVDGKGVG